MIEIRLAIDWLAPDSWANSAWFNGAPVWVTPFGLLPAITLTRSASEGSGYPRLRIGLVCAGRHSALNHAANSQELITLVGSSAQAKYCCDSVRLTCRVPRINVG